MARLRVVGKGRYAQEDFSKDSLQNFHVMMNAEFSGVSFCHPSESVEEEKDTNSLLFPRIVNTAKMYCFRVQLIYSSNLMISTQTFVLLWVPHL